MAVRSTTTPPLNPHLQRLQERMGQLFDGAAGNAGDATATVMQQVSAYAPVVLAAIERFRRPVEQGAREVVQAASRRRSPIGLKWPLIAIVATGTVAYVAGRMASRPAPAAAAAAAAGPRRSRGQADVA